MPTKEQLARKHKARMREIELKNLELEYREKENEALRQGTRKKKMSASKLMMIGIILLCLEIVIFSEWIMATRDTSALYVLLGIPAALAASFWAYASKSAKENCKNGLVYEATMEELRQRERDVEYIENEVDDNGAVG